MKKYLIIIAIFSLIGCKSLNSKPNILKSGMCIQKGKEFMKSHGYMETMLEWFHPEGARYTMWELKQGILIALSVEDKITDLTFYLSTGGPKFTRKTFTFKVSDFNYVSGQLTINELNMNKE